jgi:hypothetical protein
MGKKNAKTATNTGLPELQSYISDLQNEALVIESLLDAAMSMFAVPDRQDSMTLVEMASVRAARLNRALDTTALPKVTT